MWWGLGTGKTAKQTLKLPNKLPDKSSSQTLSRQKKGRCPVRAAIKQ